MPQQSRELSRCVLGGQGGGFSPLLFGMLLGMVLFSGLSAQWAKRELTDYQAKQAARAKAQAEETAKGMEFAVLAENAQTYRDEYALDRAKAYSASTGQTRGKQDFLVNVQADRGQEVLGQERQTVAIAATDDTLLRGQVYRAVGAQELKELSSTQPVAVFDVTAVRARQVKDSALNLNLMGEQMYVFYAAKKRFPTDDEYTTLEGKLGIKDVWGQAFGYVPSVDLQTAQLSFTTPWNYTQNLKLSLKDE